MGNLGPLRLATYLISQDGSGWTPLMIAASLKNAEGDPIIDLLLKKGADINAKSNSGQVRLILINQSFVTDCNSNARMRSTSQPPKRAFPPFVP